MSSQNISTIIAGEAATFALSLGYSQYKETSYAQKDAVAFNMYLEYLNGKSEIEVIYNETEEYVYSTEGNLVKVTLIEDDVGEGEEEKVCV